MKKVIITSVIVLTLFGCHSVNKQINQIKALENCKYEIDSTDSVFIANVNIKDLISKEKLDLSNAPRLALALLRKNVPLKARLNLIITNPSRQTAAINQFEYKVLIRGRELAAGFVNQKVVVLADGGTAQVPIQINSNIYSLVSDNKVMEAISDFIIGGPDDATRKKEVVTIKIKPTLDFGNKQIKYPGYITIEKEIDNKQLF